MRYLIYFAFFTIFSICVTLCIMAWTLHMVSKGMDETPLAYLSKIHDTLKTGDLVLFRHEKYHLPWLFGVDRMMSHMGVLWQHPEYGPLLIDMNPSVHGAFQEPLPFETFMEGPSVSVYRFSDVIRFYPGSVFLRCLKKPMDQEAESKFVQKFLSWAIHLEYDESVAKRDWIVWFALALSPLVPEVSDLIMNFTHLTLPRTSSFCTEMIAELFREAKLLPKKHISHIWGPIAWMHGIGIGAGHRDQLWEPEIQIIN